MDIQAAIVLSCFVVAGLSLLFLATKLFNIEAVFARMLSALTGVLGFCMIGIGGLPLVFLIATSLYDTIL